MSRFDSYFLMKIDDIAEYVKHRMDFFDQEAKPEVKEIGDGNLNYVFLIKDNNGKSIIVKQAGEELRISAEMKISTDRNRIESEILRLQYSLSPGSVPQVYDYDTTMCACIMEDLSDHQLMRYAMMEHKMFPRFSEDITTYMVNTLLYTTDVIMGHKEKKALVKSFINPELCEITEDLVLTEPYDDISKRNLVFPPNDQFVKKELYDDKKLHLEVAKLKFEFMNNAQALVHGDLHTGSIFVKEDSTKVFDPEFAFYGPMGYDIGNLIANMFFAWCNGYAYGKEEFCDWVMKTVVEIVDIFKEKFIVAFDNKATEPMARIEGFKEAYLNSILRDTAAFAGTELIRRTVGMAQVKDITTIADETTRTFVERINVHCAKDLIMNKESFRTGESFVKSFEKAIKKAK